ncbi:MAG: hotdog fold thioesterase [Planctomycetes bacterium]|nr:hotdog fold thioesterase [Planctomycetota bacterium]
MRAGDSFSKWLGLELVELAPGRAVVRAVVRKDMLNALGTCHGGVTFAMADSALGFAGNGRGKVAVSMEGNISFTRPAREHDVLTLTAQEISASNRLLVYSVSVVNQRGEVVAACRGTLFRLEADHFPAHEGGNP